MLPVSPPPALRTANGLPVIESSLSLSDASRLYDQAAALASNLAIPTEFNLERWLENWPPVGVSANGMMG